MEKPRRRPPRKAPTETEEQKVARAWRDVWDSPSGRLALSHLLLDLNLFTPVVANDPIAMAVAQGERNVACRIARMINLRPERLPDEARDAVQTVDAYLNQQTVGAQPFDYPF